MFFSKDGNNERLYNSCSSMSFDYNCMMWKGEKPWSRLAKTTPTKPLKTKGYISLQVKGVSKIKPQWSADKSILFKYFTFMGCLLSHYHRDKWHECNVTLRVISLYTFSLNVFIGNTEVCRLRSSRTPGFERLKSSYWIAY